MANDRHEIDFGGYDVKVREGDIFLIPTHVRHSPQHQMVGSIGLVGNNQNCLASSTACLFPASIMSTARPSQLCSTVSDTMLQTLMNRSQNSM
jgi:hypothetical protein